MDRALWVGEDKGPWHNTTGHGATRHVCTLCIRPRYNALGRCGTQLANKTRSVCKALGRGATGYVSTQCDSVMARTRERTSTAGATSLGGGGASSDISSETKTDARAQHSAGPRSLNTPLKMSSVRTSSSPLEMQHATRPFNVMTSPEVANSSRRST